MNIVPTTLTGKAVRLEPLCLGHASDLLRAAAYDEIWTYLDEPTPRDDEAIRAFIDQALDDQANDQRIPFATIATASDQAVGSTSYIDIRPTDRSLEIGWTWLTPAVWGTGINTETKYLMLRYAFEELGAVRVAIKTDARNVRSQRAIDRLGATREGTWRNHRTLSDGRLRDSIFYSVIPQEWPSIRRQLEARIFST